MKNTLKNTDKEESSSAPRPKKSKRTDEKQIELKTLVTGNRPRTLTGLFLVLFAAILAISFVSYIFTWTSDQASILSDDSGLYLFAGNDNAGNWMGRLGAWLSHIFIYKGFGISAIAWSYIFATVAFRFLFSDLKFNLFKRLEPAVTFMIFTSATLGLLFGNLFPTEMEYMGGAFGFYLAKWGIGFIGKAGYSLFIVTAWAAMLLIRFNINLSFDMFTTKSGDNDLGEFQVEEASDLTPKNNVRTTEPDPEPVQTVSPNWPFDQIEQEPTQEETEEEFVNEFIPPIPPKTEKPISNAQFEVILPEEDEFQPVKKPVSEATPELIVPPPTEDEEPDLLAKVGPYDPYLDLSTYQLPPLELLADHGDGRIRIDKEELQRNNDQIVQTLLHYKIEIEKIRATVGPTVTLYEIVPAPGVKISKIKNLEADIALSLAALGIRIIAPMPGKGTIGIEVPNKNPEIVSMRSLLASEKFRDSNFALPIALGKTITNDNFVADLAKMPHLLVAGATGQGKSVGLNAILVSLLYKKHPADLKFVLVDPKRVELPLYQTIERHFLAKLPGEDEAIITDTTRVVNTLNSLCVEMDLRYGMLQKAQVREIKAYNQKFIERKLNPDNGHRYLPYIVVVIDEFADLIITAGKEVETPIARLAQLARAVGIHLIIATQRPSVNVITGTIKANFPGRVAFRVSSKIDSRTILDEGGADQLVGRGDMLVSNGADLTRLQCAFVDTPEVENICNYIGSQKGYSSAFLLPEPEDPEGEVSFGDIDPNDRDKLFDDAARVVVTSQQGSASLLQRKLKLGYNRAGRIIDQLEAAGIVGPFEGAKARQVLFSDLNSLEEHLRKLKEQFD